jgi:hypothetical protein
MQFDRKALDRLLLLNDKQLAQVVDKLASEYGLDLGALGFTAASMGELRRTLRTADDKTLLALGEQLKKGSGKS